MKVSEMLEELGSDPEKMATFMNALGSGMMDEWDCGLAPAFKMFGEQEWALAAKSGALYAKHWESNA